MRFLSKSFPTLLTNPLLTEHPANLVSSEDWDLFLSGLTLWRLAISKVEVEACLERLDLDTSLSGSDRAEALRALSEHFLERVCSGEGQSYLGEQVVKCYHGAASDEVRLLFLALPYGAAHLPRPAARQRLLLPPRRRLFHPLPLRPRPRRQQSRLHHPPLHLSSSRHPPSLKQRYEPFLRARRTAQGDQALPQPGQHEGDPGRRDAAGRTSRCASSDRRVEVHDQAGGESGGRVLPRMSGSVCESGNGALSPLVFRLVADRSCCRRS